jgi:hypothetical protein
MFNLPRKFRRHCWNLFRFVALCTVAQIVVESLGRLSFIEHYGLIEICLFVILGGGIAWFIWRAYVGMERDLDFYDEF